MINTSKPVTSLTNITKVSFGETWGTILTTWTAEARTWLETISNMDNTARVSASITNVAKP